MKRIIVSRHPAAVEFIRRERPEFADAPVFESVTDEDVKGCVVAGNLPLGLASLAARVIAVEFEGAPPRGAEYGLEEMDAAGARLAEYRVLAIPVETEALRWEWNNGLGSRSRRPACLVVEAGGTVHRFKGESIPGVARVLGESYDKNGKWSSSTFRCISPPGTTVVDWRQSWGEGLYWPQDTWNEAFDWLLERAPQAGLSSFKMVLRADFCKTAQRFDENQAAILRFEGEG